MSKRIVCLLTSLVLLLFCTVNAGAEAVSESPHQIEMKDVPIYLGSPENNGNQTFPLYFVDGVADLPFVNLTDWVEVVNALVPDATGKYNGFKVTAEVTEDQKMFIMKRENGYQMAVDFENGLMIWDDFCGFLSGTTGPYLDLTGLQETDAQGQPVYLSRVSTRERHGHGPVLDLNSYSIPLIAQDGKYLVPLQTLSAFTLTPKSIAFYYNQECLIGAAVSMMKNELDQLVYKLEENGLVTPELAAEVEKNCATEEERKAYIRDAVAKRKLGRRFYSSTGKHLIIPCTDFMPFPPRKARAARP